QLPADWSEIKIVYREGEGIYNIRVTRGDSIYQLWLDGKRCDGDEIALESHRQEHQVEVWLGAASD
ncbi:hypothetical protein SB761_33240, partial [Pseudomonas sp. SIMBA_064]